MIMDGVVVRLLRPDDMLVLNLEFDNILKSVDAMDVPVLIAADSRSPAFIHFVFQPQSCLEQVEVEGDSPLGSSYAGIRFGGSVGLLYEFQRGQAVPYTLAGLLGCLTRATLPSSSGLECVWDLRLCPVAPDIHWEHTAALETSSVGVTPLWQTRLTGDAGPAGVVSGSRLPMRAQTDARPLRFRASSLSPDRRRDIEAATAERPLLAREVTLSALGATVDLCGDWNDLTHVTLKAYRHRAVIGRDQSVATVARGYLFPFGFSVQLDTRTERVSTPYGAQLRQESLFTVLETEVDLTRAVGVPWSGRAFPFRRLVLHAPLTQRVVVTEDLAAGIPWIDSTAGVRVLFTICAEDHAGGSVMFSAPGAFVSLAYAYGDLGAAVGGYDAACGEAAVPATGRIALVADAPESSVFDVVALCVGALRVEAPHDTLRDAGQLAAVPSLGRVSARVPAIEAFQGLTPSDAAAPEPALLELDGTYLMNGVEQTDVYARLIKQVAFTPPVSGVGGVASLPMPVAGLARSVGVVGGDLDAFRSAGFDPAAFFRPAAHLGALPLPQLFGFLSLTELLSTSIGAAPRLTTGKLPDGGMIATMTWHTPLRAGVHHQFLRVLPETMLDLSCTTAIDGRSVRSETCGELRSFALEFAGGALVVDIARFAFTAHGAGPPLLDVAVTNVGFGGGLAFLDALRRLLPTPPSGPRVVVTATGIEVSHTLAVPSVPMGMFLLQNLAVSASVLLPLDGRPVRTRFAISSRANPFLVTVSAFGGGGFVTLCGDPAGVEVEAQLEFGAAASLDLGVASASVSITAGIYMRWDGQQVVLAGFFRAVGELDVLGLVHVSVEIYLQLCIEGSDVVGAARITVRARVLFFSESFTFSVERRFSGGADPTFDVMFPSQDPWRLRCAAYAPLVRS
ncbi:hypothetical protein I0C86_14250 [Plantactinospora sp. S1510]|uniref:Uncharacterized protein n=1 Tax=Plantactinospora alkalitolerans TaxID=2789879 RepID=A0ABS0GV94_9ACTN|nr:hypothetical protein [Plantactinospora alkalitolerans]MBF9130110.1 hypothetical protein [Plantactinospora alkalitolerans]